MNGYIKQGAWIAATLLGWAMMTSSAQAASFDCAKAGTKVEHLICDDPEISKLDEELNSAYKTALQDKQQADTVKQAQKLWMKERNSCSDSACVKLAYEARLATLITLSGEGAPQDTAILTEKAKGEKVREILSGLKTELIKGVYDPDDVKFCNAFLDDFKQQRGIEYIEPKFRTNDYNHPEFVRLRNQCPNYYWPAPAECNAASLALNLRSLSGEAAQKKAQEICATQFGFNEFALYEFDFGDHKENVIYKLRSPGIYYEDLLGLLDASHRASDYRFDPLRPVLDNFYPLGGYDAYDFSTCSTHVLNGYAAHAASFSSPERYLGLIKYRGGYYVFNLQRMNRQDEFYRFVLGGKSPTCSYDAVKSKLSKKESK